MPADQNEIIFDKKIIFIEIIPILILLALSLLFFSSITTYRSLGVKIINFIVGVAFLYIPLKGLKYYFSFKNISFINASIKINFNGRVELFNVPEDIIQMRYGQANVEIELNNNKQKFIILSRLLKNKAEFVAHLDKMLANQPTQDKGKYLPKSLDSLMDDQRRQSKVNTIATLKNIFRKK